MGLDLTLQLTVALQLTNTDLFLCPQPTEFRKKKSRDLAVLSCNFNLQLCVWNGLCLCCNLYALFLNVITTFCHSVL